MEQERIIRNTELLQIHLLDNLYAISGSEYIMLQGSSAIRWVHGGTRFAEDLDFATHLPADTLSGLLIRLQSKVRNACISQFGPGKLEQTSKGKSADSLKTLFVFRPEAGHERIVVKMNFEMLMTDQDPAAGKYILRDLTAVRDIISRDSLILPYSSSIILAEIPVQILADKVRTLYETDYVKGCDIYDIWWIHRKLNINPSWDRTRETLALYRSPFIPVRQADYFQKTQSHKEIISALKTDLPGLIPSDVHEQYESQDFVDFIESVSLVTRSLLDQGMRTYLEDYAANLKRQKSILDREKKKSGTRGVKGTIKVKKAVTPTKKQVESEKLKGAKKAIKTIAPTKKEVKKKQLKGIKKIKKAVTPAKKEVKKEKLKGAKKVIKKVAPTKKEIKSKKVKGDKKGRKSPHPHKKRT